MLIAQINVYFFSTITFFFQIFTKLVTNTRGLNLRSDQMNTNCSNSDNIQTTTADKQAICDVGIDRFAEARSIADNMYVPEDFQTNTDIQEQHVYYKDFNKYDEVNGNLQEDCDRNITRECLLNTEQDRNLNERQQLDVGRQPSTGRDIPHAKEPNRDIPHDGEQIRDIPHDGEPNRDIPHVREQIRDIPHVREQIRDIPHVREPNRDIPHVREQIRDIPHDREPTKNIPHARERNREAGPSRQHLNATYEERQEVLTPVKKLKNLKQCSAGLRISRVTTGRSTDEDQAEDRSQYFTSNESSMSEGQYIHQHPIQTTSILEDRQYRKVSGFANRPTTNITGRSYNTAANHQMYTTMDGNAHEQRNLPRQQIDRGYEQSEVELQQGSNYGLGNYDTESRPMLFQNQIGRPLTFEYNHGYASSENNTTDPEQQTVRPEHRSESHCTIDQRYRNNMMDFEREFPPAEEIDKSVCNESSSNSVIDVDAFTDENSHDHSNSTNNWYSVNNQTLTPVYHKPLQIIRPTSTYGDNQQQNDMNECILPGENRERIRQSIPVSEVPLRYDHNRDIRVKAAEKPEVKFNFNPIILEDTQASASWTGNEDSFQKLYDYEQTQCGNNLLQGGDLFINPNMDRITRKPDCMKNVTPSKTDRLIEKDNKPYSRSIEEDLRETTKKFLTNSQQFSRLVLMVYFLVLLFGQIDSVCFVNCRREA